ncbi:hypothetical protein G6F52_013181 [Rhizopus delemar]|nr:hypothetical protein G6F54_011519 [Rhizopus delemar]KAG1494054.1 hypothetical protein G6F52_013181 [Rhizopus delemar]
MQKPDGFGCVCLKVLYPEDQFFRNISGAVNLPCMEWKLQPICIADDETMKMVCKFHLNTAEEEFSNLFMVYPGDLVPETKDLNYRERSVLSPIKLMSQITRKSTLVHGRIGHHEVKDPMYTTHIYEFAEMAYGVTLSLFFVRGDPAIIRKKIVEDAYRALQRTHPLLSRYDMPNLTFSLVNYHDSENKKHVNIYKGWLNNALFTNENTMLEKWLGTLTPVFWL